MKHVPDKWIVVTITVDNKTIDKVLASWYGGYTGSDSWKLSSSIEKVVEAPEYYEFHNSSGSIYVCHKQAYGTSSYASNVYNTWRDSCVNKPDVSIETNKKYTYVR